MDNSPAENESELTNGAPPAAKAAANGDAILRTEQCTIRFGGLVAVSDLNTVVGKNEIYGLIGPNGAGKTTIFNLLTGVYKPTSGKIFFEGKRVDGLRPYQISSCGVSRTFQNIRLFPSMSVLENVMTGLPHSRKAGPGRCCVADPEVRPRRARAQGVRDGAA